MHFTLLSPKIIDWVFCQGEGLISHGSGDGKVWECATGFCQGTARCCAIIGRRQRTDGHMWVRARPHGHGRAHFHHKATFAHAEQRWTTHFCHHSACSRCGAFYKPSLSSILVAIHLHHEFWGNFPPWQEEIKMLVNSQWFWLPMQILPWPRALRPSDSATVEISAPSKQLETMN